MTQQITIDEWKAEIERIESEPLTGGDEGCTSRELCEIFGRGLTQTKEILRRGLENGTYAKGFRLTRSSTGAVVKVPVYRVVKKDTAK